MADVQGCSLDGLTEDRISTAFQKTVSENTIKEGTLTIIKEEHYDRAISFCRNDFLKTEHVSATAGIDWNPELEEMCMSTFKQNISLALLDDITGDVMGVRFMRIRKSDETFTVEQFNDPVMKKMVSFWMYTDSKSKFFEHYKVNEAVHFFGLGVAQKYRRRGLGTMLVDLSIKFLNNLDISPLYIMAEGSSVYSQKIFEKLDFELLAEVQYDEYRKNGEIVIPSSDTNKYMKAYGKIV